MNRNILMKKLAINLSFICCVFQNLCLECISLFFFFFLVYFQKSLEAWQNHFELLGWHSFEDEEA